MYIIAGLGNPGKKYEGTRHNVGFDCIDALGDKYNINIRENKGKALVGTGVINGQKVMLVKPQTFMNLSGTSLRELVNFYKIDAEEELLVLFDDISLPPGEIRIRTKGSAGGHNGIKNIIEQLGTQAFSRVKIGVGEKPSNWDLADYVLARPDKEDAEAMQEGIKQAVEAVAMIIEGNTDAAMNRFNVKKRKKVVEEACES